ncbi:endocuticle structural glycoprotein SgAbd-2-like, partial [Macrobrachium rosenbergii]|uniref:endocuticle structural glycoprotein SgAbd-2-like n=1 Tax=Macrobrachium rosenbergii TaxID=79674 RepID=UPI0034D4F546
PAPPPQRPSFGPPPGSAPGGISGSQPPPPQRPSFGPPPGSAPAGISGSQPPPPQRPSFGPPPVSAPAGISGVPVIPILVDDREGPDADGSYRFRFETGDGIQRQEQGAPLPETGAVAQQGDWSFTFPDGSPAVFRFVADENGYRVESDLLPTPPPLPAHAIAQIEKARLENAALAASSGGRDFQRPGLSQTSSGGGYGGR